MRYKIVPEHRSVGFLRDVQGALPLVPGSVEDCCSRIRDQTDLQSRDEAREYLTFAQALGLASQRDRGFHRTKGEPTAEELAERYLENVFGAREVVESVESEPKSVEEAFHDIRTLVPQWERDRHADWEDEWMARTKRLLDWSVEFGLVERAGDQYRRSSHSS